MFSLGMRRMHAYFSFDTCRDRRDLRRDLYGVAADFKEKTADGFLVLLVRAVA